MPLLIKFNSSKQICKITRSGIHRTDDQLVLFLHLSPEVSPPLWFVELLHIHNELSYKGGQSLNMKFIYALVCTLQYYNQYKQYDLVVILCKAFNNSVHKIRFLYIELSGVCQLACFQKLSDFRTLGFWILRSGILSLFKNIFERRKFFDIVLNMLNSKDRFYIVASIFYKLLDT